MTWREIGGAGTLRAFRHRNFRLFFGGQAISLAGSWMQAVAQSWLVLTLTGDPLALGVVAAAQWTPVLLLGLFGGLIADALPKRETLIAVQAAMAVQALLLAVLTATGVVEVWMVLLLAVVLGCLNAVEMPVRQSFAVEMVGREDVVNAVALNSAIFNVARVVGPAIAGLTIALVDISFAFFVNAASFLGVIVALLLMRREELRLPPAFARPHSAREVLASVGEGVGYTRRTPSALLPVIVVGLAATIGMNFQVTIPPFARDVLGGDAATFGFLMTASGVGSVVAALYLASRRRPSPWAIATGATLLGAALVVTAAVPAFAVALVALAVAGFGAISMAVNGNTLIQATVPDELRGRVISVYTTVFAGSTPIGALFAGFVASTWGPVAALFVGGSATVVVGVLALAWLRAHPGAVRLPSLRAPVPIPPAMAPAPPVGLERRLDPVSSDDRA